MGEAQMVVVHPEIWTVVSRSTFIFLLFSFSFVAQEVQVESGHLREARRGQVVDRGYGDGVLSLFFSTLHTPTDLTQIQPFNHAFLNTDTVITVMVANINILSCPFPSSFSHFFLSPSLQSLPDLSIMIELFLDNERAFLAAFNVQ